MNYRFRIDTRIRTTRDLEAITDHPNLAVLPSAPAVKREDGLMDAPDDFAAREALRELRTNLRYVNVDSPPWAIVITSSVQGEGKSTIAGNLARVVAESVQRIVLVDADLRRPPPFITPSRWTGPSASRRQLPAASTFRR